MWSDPDSEDNADQIWASERQDQIDDRKPRTVSHEDVPNALRPGIPPPANYSSLETEENVWGEAANPAPPTAGETEQSLKADVNRVPTVLRPGGGAMRETNPFKRKPPGAAPTPRKDNTVEPPTSSFAQLNVEETGSNPWEPTVEDSNPGVARTPVPTVIEPETGKDIWDSGKPSRQATPGPPPSSPGLVSMPSESGSAVWDEKQPMRAPTPEEKIAMDEEQELEDSHIWDDLGALDKGKGPEKLPPPIPSQSSGSRMDEWNMIDHDSAPPAPLKRQDTWENFDETLDAADSSALPQHTPGEAAPALPPRKSTEQTTAQPISAPQPPREVAEPKNETYQIKVLNWHDVEAAKNPRQSPILVQNANGPCPLVALVNALTLTTPANVNTALVETLRTREQVSLSLVIDAVFDELMSSRRTNPNAELPDVAELYEFLKGLHTGMNVNPRFIPTEDLVKAFKRTSLTHLHPTERNDSIPGTFEDTTEMRLYSTFSIPLIHGWLPPKSDPVYDAFTRRAASYEDVQNLLFMEEELEDKLSSPHHQGLTEEEQHIYQDVLTIKSFLGASATQLTPWGLQTIRQAMRPGSVAILFRNDHFSTLYRHPQTHELLTLVTDAGYASHEEVVWESLVDVSGEHAEFFSGDFRLVGGASHAIDHNTTAARSSSSADGGAWTTVQGRRGRTHTQNPTVADQPPLSPTHEQEDRDLALAMQLQEEEDERARAEQARRRRESQLSEQYIEQQGRQPAAGRGSNPQNRGNNRNNNSSNNRRSSSALNTTPTNASTTSVSSRGSTNRGGRAAPQSQTVRSLIPPRGGTAVNRAADEGEDEAPPSYEQAAKAPAYVPPAGNGNGNGGASSASAITGAPRRTSSAAAASAQGPSMLAPGPAPGQPGTPGPRQGSTSSYPGSFSGGRPTGTPTGQRMPNRQGVPMSATRPGERDRECVVM